MTSSDRSLLGVLAAAAALVLWASMSGERTELGLPNLFGTGKKDRGGRTGVPPAPRGYRSTTPTKAPGTTPGGKGPPILEVTGPRIRAPGEK